MQSFLLSFLQSQSKPCYFELWIIVDLLFATESTSYHLSILVSKLAAAVLISPHLQVGDIVSKASGGVHSHPSLLLQAT